MLIADDDPNILRALSFLMRQQGHEVRTATDGAEVLAAVEAERPDLLLLDVMMPRSDGYDVCRTLRAAPANKDLRIVILTARGQSSERHRGLEAGADAYITKPFAIGDVVDCVARMLRGDPAPQAS